MIGGARVLIIYERYVVTNENIILNDNSFTDKCVARNFAICSYLGELLYFHKSTYLRVVSDEASIQIDKLGELYVFPQFHIL